MHLQACADALHNIGAVHGMMEGSKSLQRGRGPARHFNEKGGTAEDNWSLHCI
jgi:hypothetical protein